MKKILINTTLLLIFITFTASISYSDENEFSHKGFIEFESFFNINNNTNFNDSIVKNEIRSRNTIQFGSENSYIYAVPDLYLQSSIFNDNTSDKNSYNSENTVSRNLSLSSESCELNFNELYYNYGKGNYRIRIGNQIYAWGTADVFNPTAYFTPKDLREFIFKSDDQKNIGIPSVSGMVFIGDYTIETVYSPVHIPALISRKNEYWYLNIDNYNLPIELGEIGPMKPELSNAAYGMRVSTSMKGCDISGSLYYGPDNNPLYKPEGISIEEGLPVSIIISPENYNYFAAGLDFSKSLDDFVIQFEVAYSPNKTGYVLQDFTNTANLEFPFKTQKSDYISYTAGFNYFIPLYKIFEDHEGDPVFTFEWSRSDYLKKNLAKPLLTDIISLKLEDQFLSSRLKISFSSVMDTLKKGSALWAKTGWDFQNGWYTELSLGIIKSNSPITNTNESLFYYYRNNDTLMIKVKYDFF